MAIFQKDYKVYINHTDAGGIVYHANHLTFFENCRRDWLATLGFDGYFFDLNDSGTDRANHGQGGAVHFVVSRADLRYIAPLLVDDLLSVRVDGFVLRPASLILQQSIYRQGEMRAATTGEITLACVQNNGKGLRPYRLPDGFVRVLQDLLS